MKKYIFMIFYCFVFVSAVFSQDSNEVGSPSIINYSPQEYNASKQTFAIIQDDRGIMYFGSFQGLLEFDGSSWRHQVPNKSAILSLAKGDNKKIYAGALGDVGYFLPDSSGQLKFHSLLKFISKNKRDFSPVWSTCVNNDKVYFQTFNYIFIWNIKKKEFKIIQPENTFHAMFDMNGTIYVREWGKGLEVIFKL